MAKLTFVLLAVVAVVVLATTEVSAKKSAEGKKPLFHLQQSEATSVGDDCECNDCAATCISAGFIGGMCYDTLCYCAS